MLTTLLFLVAFGTAIETLARPAFVPSGARVRVDPDAGNPWYVKGHWTEIADYGDWGQGQCQPTGFECHRWDWITWWMPEISEPSGGSGSSLYFNPGDIIYYDGDPATYHI